MPTVTEATLVNCVEVRDRGDTCQLYRGDNVSCIEVCSTYDTCQL